MLLLKVNLLGKTVLHTKSAKISYQNIISKGFLIHKETKSNEDENIWRFGVVMKPLNFYYKLPGSWRKIKE